MIILAIETSCDETAISVVQAEGDLTRPRFKVLAHQVSSQVALHAPFGGVVPNIAKREHLKNLPIVLDQALAEAKLTHEEAVKIIDAIAVTVGPGLEPALWTGIEFAKKLAEEWQKPLIPTNHLEGHIISVLAPNLDTGCPSGHPVSIKFPAVALIISGGHTELVLVKKLGEYERVGSTRDDAVGEAFDKVARLLGLPYPGGASVSKLAKEARDTNLTSDWHLPRPMLHSPDLNFSFSGLKTAVRYGIEKHGTMSELDKQTLAREFEDAVIEVLTAKTLKAIEAYEAKSLIIGGGVIANQTLRDAFTKLTSNFPSPTSPLPLLIPDFKLSTDNATMIAMASYIRYLKNEVIPPDQVLNTTITANGNLALK